MRIDSWYLHLIAGKRNHKKNKEEEKLLVKEAPHSITASQLRELIVGRDELALIDLREGGVFSQSHLLYAANCPLSQLEFLIENLVPRKSVLLVICVEAPDYIRAEKGLRRLAALGYSNLMFLEGGIQAWKNAGYELFSGVHVPSKAFGEFVEKNCQTPHISAQDLAARTASGEDIVILDSRPFNEYHKMNIPNGIDVPGAELAYRIHDLAPRPETTVVVNCAGRTRSIIGAQSLINADIPNPVIALENGTMGWHLAGFKLERNQNRTFEAVSAEARRIAEGRAASVRARFDVPEVELQQLAQWQADTSRTTYLLDVRTPTEFEFSHLPGSKSAPGGQLVQATDLYVGVRRARLILIDDTGVRASMSASWLIQMGWHDVHVLYGVEELFTETGRLPTAPRNLSQAPTEFITAAELKIALSGIEPVQIIDLATSLQYRDQGHIPSAWFAVRSHMPDNLSFVEQKTLVVLTSPNGQLAELAFEDASESGLKVKVLKGGNASWMALGEELEYGFTNMADETTDIWYKPYDFNDKDKSLESSMQQYLTWEVDLVPQIARDGTTEFKIPG
ncbi:MAG: rhodanese-related sulfurtransferase [Granulosicoccus sp.]